MDFTLLIFLGVLIVVFVITQIFNRKNRKKEEQKYTDMIDTLEKGDKVYLISRLIAYVVKVEKLPTGERYVTVETGLEGSKSTLTFDSNAIYSILQKANAPKINAEPAVEEGQEVEVVTEEKTEEKTEESK